MTDQDAGDASRANQGSFAYLFEAKGIQRYIFDSGPLRDLVAASDLVDSLATSNKEDLLRDALQAFGIEKEVTFSRRAGGAFLLHGHKEALKKARALWRLVAGLSRPGLEMSDAWGEGENEIAALRDAYQNGSAVRFNTAAELAPTGHPFTAFNPRTGRVATRVFTYSDDRPLFDLLSETQRIHADRLTSHDNVALRFLPSELRQENYRFPRNLDPDEDDTAENPRFPFRNGNDTRIAIVHADLSGLGQIFNNATQNVDDVNVVFDVAVSIQNAIETAAQNAAKMFLIPHAEKRAYGRAIALVFPARPVVLGGDDVTILVRADLALPFAADLLSKIEQETKKIAQKTGKPHLSACAGVAIARAGQPFLMVNTLAESLCSTAKREAKKKGGVPYPSLLAFHIARSTLQEDYSEILQREKTGPKGLHLTVNPLAIGKQTAATGRPSWDSLLGLAKAFNLEPRGRGKLIELRDIMATQGVGESNFEDIQKLIKWCRAQIDEYKRKKRDNIDGALGLWTRYREVLSKRNRSASKRNKSALDEIDTALNHLGVIDPECLPVIQVEPGSFYFPIPDALELIDLGSLEVCDAKPA